MSENKRFKVVGNDDFFQHIEDTTLTEDKHEGSIYNIYQVVKVLNSLHEENEQLKKENEQLKQRIKELEEKNIDGELLYLISEVDKNNE